MGKNGRDVGEVGGVKQLDRRERHVGEHVIQEFGNPSEHHRKLLRIVQRLATLFLLGGAEDLDSGGDSGCGKLRIYRT
jgi:hypothetical protein